MPNDNKKTGQDVINQTPITDDAPPVLAIENDTPPMLQEQQPVVSSSAQPSMQTATLVTDDSNQQTFAVPADNTEDQGSAAPADDVLMPPVVTSQKKKFAGGKVIATILGLFLLVGGLGAGVILTQQNQNIAEKAGEECDYGAITGTVGVAQVTDGPKLCAGDKIYYNPATGNYSLHGPSGNLIGEYRIVGSGGGGGACRADTVNCPPGSTVDYNQPLYQYCRDVHDGGSSCSGPGTAQKETGCCVAAGKDGCGNPEYTTYNCCPADAPSVCTDTVSNYTKNITWPGNPQTTCFEYDSFGILRNDTYISHTNVNCREELVEQGEGQKPKRENVCDAVVTCQKTVKVCKCEGGTPPPTPVVTARCQNIKAYSSTWVELTAAQLAALKPTDTVNFCVAGTATGGSFDKAKFTINGTAQAETSTVRPSSTDFCQSYVIPTGTTTFNLTAQVHHTTLGWK